MRPATTDDDEEKLRDPVQNAESGAAVRREEEVRVQSNAVLEPGERLRSWSESQAVGRVHADLRTPLYGQPTHDLVKAKSEPDAKSQSDAKSEPDAKSQSDAESESDTRSEQDVENLTLNVKIKSDAESQSDAGGQSDAKFYSGGRLQSSRAEPKGTRKSAFQEADNLFHKDPDRIEWRWTSSLANIRFFFRGRSKHSQDEKRESLSRSHRKTKWKDKFAGPWRMWEKRIESRQELQRRDCTCSPKSKMKPCGVTAAQARHEQVLQKEDLPYV